MSLIKSLAKETLNKKWYRIRDDMKEDVILRYPYDFESDCAFCNDAKSKKANEDDMICHSCLIDYSDICTIVDERMHIEDVNKVIEFLEGLL